MKAEVEFETLRISSEY